MKKHFKLSKLNKVLFKIIAVLILIDTICMMTYKATITPYAITTNGQTICCVKGEKTAQDTIKTVYDSYTEDTANVKAVKTDLKIEKDETGQQTVSKEEAVDAIIQSEAKTEIVTAKTEVKDYTPEPEYKKDDSMLAGQSETIEEGSDGKREVISTDTVINGKIKDTQETDSTIIEQGKSVVIKKGTRGLPDGENWKSYEGYPIYKSGDDIVETALSYVGKLEYVWGGKDLNKGVDCSGFIIALYRLYGINLGYPLEKEGISVPYSEAKPGDILYFPGHFGMYIGDGMMVHASNPERDVCVSSVSGYTILDVRRIVPNE